MQTFCDFKDIGIVKFYTILLDYLIFGIYAHRYMYIDCCNKFRYHYPHYIYHDIYLLYLDDGKKINGELPSITLSDFTSHKI